MKGRQIGGSARAESLTPMRRREIAIKASNARSLNKDFNVTHGSENNSLILGNLSIPCFVLANGKRVLLQRNLASVISLNATGGDRITRLVNTKWLTEFMSEDMKEKINNPITFKLPSGKCANGYDATLLIDICTSILNAKDKITLTPVQKRIANQCDIIIRSVAKVGIVALVDEVTGYQEDREKNELSEILQKFIAKELQTWIHTFPLEFYKELYRIRGLEYGKERIPLYFGHLTNNIIYKRLAPEILDHLKRLTPKSPNGNKTARYFQSLSSDTGYHRLKEHLGSVVTLMKLSDNYEDFESKLNRIHPLFDND